jgi:mono/diheme cytochrome c family protein
MDQAHYLPHAEPRGGGISIVDRTVTGTYRALRLVRSHVWFMAWAITFGLLAYPSARELVLRVEVTPVKRGYQVALRAGCFDCHGPGGGGGVANPGSDDGEVPGLSGGTPMMWAKSEQEVLEYILDGAPAAKRAAARHHEQMKGQLLAMPAYRGYLSAGEIEDLMSYVRAVSGLVKPTDHLALQGQELAYRLGCFHCHGPMGAGTSGNIGSFKGYIPGWMSDDFRDLVRSEEELRSWILDGGIPRLRHHPIAKHFVRWQRVRMPAYRSFVTDEQLQALMRFVRWVNDGSWQTETMDLGEGNPNPSGRSRLG